MNAGFAQELGASSSQDDSNELKFESKLESLTKPFGWPAVFLGKLYFPLPTSEECANQSPPIKAKDLGSPPYGLRIRRDHIQKCLQDSQVGLQELLSNLEKTPGALVKLVEEVIIVGGQQDPVSIEIAKRIDRLVQLRKCPSFPTATTAFQIMSIQYKSQKVAADDCLNKAIESAIVSYGLEVGPKLSQRIGTFLGLLWAHRNPFDLGMAICGSSPRFMCLNGSAQEEAFCKCIPTIVASATGYKGDVALRGGFRAANLVVSRMPAGILSKYARLSTGSQAAILKLESRLVQANANLTSIEVESIVSEMPINLELGDFVSSNSKRKIAEFVKKTLGLSGDVEVVPPPSPPRSGAIVYQISENGVAVGFLKLYPHGDDASALSEIGGQALVSEIGASGSRTSSVFKVDIDGKSRLGIVMRAIPGTSLEDLIATGMIKDPEQLGRSIASEISKVHGARLRRWTELGPEEQAEIMANRKALSAKLGDLLKELGHMLNAKVISEKDFERLSTLITASRDQYLNEPEYVSLLHGDFHAGNVILDSSGRPTLIDLQSMRFSITRRGIPIGDPNYDVSRMYIDIRSHCPTSPSPSSCYRLADSFVKEYIGMQPAAVKAGLQLEFDRQRDFHWLRYISAWIRLGRSALEKCKMVKEIAIAAARPNTLTCMVPH